VALKIDPAQAARLPQDCRVTMRVRALPLAKVLASLANLYGGQWQQGEDASFVWLPLESPLTLQARRLIGAEGMLTKDEYQAGLQQNADLAVQVFDSVDEARWRSPEGVAIADISPELQNLLVQQKQRQSAQDVARAYIFYQNFLALSPSLRLSRSAATVPRLWTAKISDRLPRKFRIRLMLGDRVVVPVFDAPTSTKPGAPQADDGEDDEYLNRLQQKADRLRERLRNPSAR